MRKIILACCALAILAVAGPAMAKDAQKYAVNKIKYMNRGIYDAKLVVRFTIKDKAGEDVLCKMTAKQENSAFIIKAGRDHTFQLGDIYGFHLKNDNPAGCDKNRKKFSDNGIVPIGSEVWAFVNIISGEKENCEKKHTKKFYYHPKGGTLVYKTKGTTYNNNRCRVQSTGDVLWEDVR